MTVTGYCPSCGENVQADLDMESGQEVYRCQYCTLIVRQGVPKAPIATPQSRFPLVLVAEDTSLLRQILRDTLLGDRLCEDLRDCKDGAELLETVTRLHREGRKADLAIIDLGMPILNGFHAAVAIRAVERAFQSTLTPIIFFTAHGCDDNLRKMLEYCAPARYLNKGNATMDKIASRLAHILQTLP